MCMGRWWWSYWDYMGRWYLLVVLLGVGEGGVLIAGVVGWWGGEVEVPRLRGWVSEVLILQFFLEW